MEAIMIGGFAVAVIGGYYATVDFLNDLGFKKASNITTKKSVTSNRYRITPQSGIEKMAGMHV